jgi:hypothetical protein
MSHENEIDKVFFTFFNFGFRLDCLLVDSCRVHDLLTMLIAGTSRFSSTICHEAYAFLQITPNN